MSTKVVSKRCPVCQTKWTVANQQVINGLLCWVCPTCGFTTPVDKLTGKLYFATGVGVTLGVIMDKIVLR